MLHKHLSPEDNQSSYMIPLWFVYLTGYATLVLVTRDLINYLYNNITMLKGKKTFITAALMVAYVFVGYYLGQGFNTELLLAAMATAGLRDAIN